MYKPNMRYTVLLHLICGGYAASALCLSLIGGCYHIEFVGGMQRG